MTPAPQAEQAPAKLEPLIYHHADTEAWSLDVKVVVLLALVAGAIGVMNGGVQAWMVARPGALGNIGAGMPGDSATRRMLGYSFEGLKLLGSALLLAGAIAFFSRKRVARSLLIAGAGTILLTVLIGVVWYWTDELARPTTVSGTGSSPTKKAADWIVKTVFHLEAVVQRCAIPLLVIFTLHRPSIAARFRAV